ncbi:hypothetical protein [Flavobacterium ardleyense]|uniref:hypothetical protein n=1 Tax=Flavobacterium ardleyense TaxID=2038737 RepID=UPI00298BE70A|nr:hypothetical protein [Flavobacterium ardleyense]
MNNIEDERSAASIHAAISAQIFGASLVLIGVLIGYLDIKDIEYRSTSGVLTFLSIFLLLSSTIIAGLGLKKLRNQGTIGNWNLSDIHIYFRVQTFLNYISIMLFLIIVFNTNKNTDDKFEKESLKIETKKFKMDSLNLIQNNQKMQILNSNLDSLKSSFENLNCCKKRIKKPCE